MKIDFSKSEVEGMKLWAESELSAKFIGKAGFEFPDEFDLLKKINQFNGDSLDLSKRNLELLLIWSENMSGSVTESQIVKKAGNGLEQLNKKKFKD